VFLVLHFTYRAQEEQRLTINAWTILDRYPACHIHDYSHQLFGCSFLSKIEPVRAYNQIPVHPDYKQKTAITILFGLFEFPFTSLGATPPRRFNSSFFLRPNLFAICNNTFSKWWGNVKDGL
jgi:hypothetical protein